MRKIPPLLLTTILTVEFGRILIPAVAEERGYFAIGGEWILLIMFASVAYWVIKQFFKPKKQYRRG